MRGWIVVAVVGLGACGGDGKTGAQVDAATSQVDAPPQAGPTQTLVTAMLHGGTVTLRYGTHEYNWPNGLNWVCVADVPVTYAECQQTGGPNRVILLGAYGLDSNGNPKWSTIQTWLYRIGPGADSEYADNGTLTVFKDGVDGLQMTLDLDFKEPQHTTGSIVVP